METFTVRNGAWVMIGDGKKVLVLQNEGDAQILNLRRVSVREQNNPATRDQGSDAPGRSSSSIGGRVGSMGETDWHQIEENRFASSIAADLNKAARDRLFKELVVIAPPRTMAELRREWNKDTRKLIVAEISKDYTHHPIPDIEAMLLTFRPEDIKV